MAMTQEFYRLGGRLPRYTTKLSAFSNGMYETQQMIPEGYAKSMVNYDIDDTGTCIRPRAGREIIQTIPFDSKVLGPASITDYIYAYNTDETEVTSLKDIVLSYGLYTKLDTLVSVDAAKDTRPIYIASMTREVDESLYDAGDQGDWILRQEGEKYTELYDEFWGLSYDKDEEHFDKLNNQDVGYVIARTVDNAYAFDKPFEGSVGRPIGALVNNELITFAGPKFLVKDYPNTEGRSELLNFGKPELAKLVLVDKPEGTVIRRKLIEPQILNPLEAQNSGFNILLPDPYTFQNEEGGALSGLGIIMYTTDSAERNTVLAPKVGQTVDFGVYYQYTGTTKIKYKVEILDLTNDKSDWTVVQDFGEGITPSPTTPIMYRYMIQYTRFAVKFTLRKDDATDDSTDVPVVTSISADINDAYSKYENQTYDLTTGTGMISWQGCVGVYGVTGAKDTIFFSDIENPSYFPFPYNIIQFDNEILAVHNYLDYLLVVTVDSIWLVTGNTTIRTSTQKRILANIHIPEIDAINLVILKDQIFFKTDSQFYVLKPNQYTSDATDLKNYVNSTAIANFTQTFTSSVVELLNKVYVLTWQRLTAEARKQIRFEDFKVYDTHSIVKDSEVHYIYKIKPILTGGLELDYLNVHLVYNTLTRSWRMYLVAIGDDTVHYNPVLYRNKQSGIFCEFFPRNKTDGTSTIHVVKQTREHVSDNITDGDWNLTSEYNNYPYLDTGNVALDDAFTKRFREVQFNLYNMEQETIRFFSDFKLDGRERIHATSYELQHITDVNDPDYGVIYVTPVENTNVDAQTASDVNSEKYGVIVMAPISQTNVDLQGSTVTTEDDGWSIDLSKFPELSMTTVRFTLQGRGRRGSLQLLNTSLKRYELSNMNWVYRTMSAR